MAPTPELIDDVAAEIFLRLPPDEPEHLFRISLVCKAWHRVVTDPDFLRRYRAFHGAPPLLGLLHRLQVVEEYGDADLTPRIAPTTAVPAFITPASVTGDSRVVDCSHGRVLLRMFGMCQDFLVWDPVTGGCSALPNLKLGWVAVASSAAVLCAVAACDHLDCHGGPFRVVFLTCDTHGLVWASVYSSETGTWRTPTSVPIGEGYYLQGRRGALIRDEIYFTLTWGRIVMYNWRNNSLSEVNPPPQPDVFGAWFTVMVMQDSSLGLASMEDSGSLYMWSRKVNAEGSAEWLQCKVIDLRTMIPRADPYDKATLVGFAEGVGLNNIFVSTGAGLFTFEVNSRHVKKVGEAGNYHSVLPYMSFYTPDRARLLQQPAHFVHKPTRVYDDTSSSHVHWLRKFGTRFSKLFGRVTSRHNLMRQNVRADDARR